MIREEEHLLFIKEIGRLLTDFNNCKDEDLKEIIYSDILLLSNVINPDYEFNLNASV